MSEEVSEETLMVTMPLHEYLYMKAEIERLTADLKHWKGVALVLQHTERTLNNG